MRIEFGVEWPESIEILDTNEFNPENIYDVYLKDIGNFVIMII